MPCASQGSDTDSPTFTYTTSGGLTLKLGGVCTSNRIQVPLSGVSGGRFKKKILHSYHPWSESRTPVRLREDRPDRLARPSYSSAVCGGYPSYLRSRSARQAYESKQAAAAAVVAVKGNEFCLMSSGGNSKSVRAMRAEPRCGDWIGGSGDRDHG